MCLAVYSPLDFDSLEQHVISFFSLIPLKNIGRISHQNLPPVYVDSEMQKIIRFKSTKKTKKLQMSFILPSFQSKWRSNPLKILSHLVGHESEGSILSKLISKKLALRLSSYFENFSDYFTIFGISIPLTNEGFTNYEQAIEIVFEYLKMLSVQGLPNYVFREIQTMDQLAFEFKPKSSGINKVISVSEKMGDFPPELVNKSGYLLDDFEPNDFKITLKLFSTKNLLVELSSSTFDNLPLTEPIYKTSYSIDNLDPKFVGKLSNVLEAIDLSPSGKFINIFIFKKKFLTFLCRNQIFLFQKNSI